MFWQIYTKNISRTEFYYIVLIKWHNLLLQLIDEYSRRHTGQISEEISAAIARIVADTKVQQQTLLANLNAASAIIEEDYLSLD